MASKTTKTSETQNHPFIIGKNYLIRGTLYNLGTVVKVTDNEIIMKGGGWVANTARWSTCISEGKLNEYEAIPPDMERIVSRADMIDAHPWNHELPSRSM